MNDSLLMAYTILINFLLFGMSLSKELTIKPRIILNDDDDCSIGEESCNPSLYSAHILLTHNGYRSRIAFRIAGHLTASNMLKLIWNETLANEAQKYAVSCLLRGFKEDCPAPQDFDGDINFSWTKYINRKSGYLKRISFTVNYWTIYMKTYLEENVEKTNKVQLYHATSSSEYNWSKIVRARTWKIGCGLADLPTSDSNLNEFAEVLTCFYEDSKLKVCDEVFRIGPPCSACPISSSCVLGEIDHYEKNLCNMELDTKMAVNIEDSPEEQKCRLNLKSTSEVSWKCDLKNYGEDCQVQQPCSSPWKVDLTGGFKIITVKENCTSANVFQALIAIKGPSCFKFQYIKEVNGIESFQSMIMGFAFKSDSGEIVQEIKNDDTNNWTDINLNIPWNSGIIQVGIFVHSRSTTLGQQEIKVRNFRVVEGYCS